MKAKFVIAALLSIVCVLSIFAVAGHAPRLHSWADGLDQRNGDKDAGILQRLRAGYHTIA